MKVTTAVIANAILGVAWIVAPPPVVIEALTPAPELRAFITLQVPRKLDDSYEADDPNTGADTPMRWVRLEEGAPTKLEAIADGLALELADRAPPPVPPIVYMEAEDSMPWGNVMASLDRMLGAAGDDALLVLVVR